MQSINVPGAYRSTNQKLLITQSKNRGQATAKLVKNYLCNKYCYPPEFLNQDDPIMRCLAVHPTWAPGLCVSQGTRSFEAPHQGFSLAIHMPQRWTKIIKDFRFLFVLALGSSADHNRFCFVSWCELLHYLDPLSV